MRRRPSGEIIGSMSVSSVVFVSWVRPLPSVAIDQTSYRPVRSEMKTSRLPSGENVGWRSFGTSSRS